MGRDEEGSSKSKPRDDLLIERICNEHRVGAEVEDPIEFSTRPGAFRAEPGNRLVPATAENPDHDLLPITVDPLSAHASHHEALNRSHNEVIVVDAALVQSNRPTRNAGLGGGGPKLVRAHLYRPESRRMRLALCASLVLLVTVAIGIGLGLAFRTTYSTVSESPSAAPTMSSVQSVWIMRAQLFPSTLKALEAPNSTQTQALEWVMESDSGYNLTFEREKQRFALASLYFALGGPTSLLNGKWLNRSVHECNWTDVKCSSEIVESIQLSGNQRLQGSVAPEVGLLTALDRLSIREIAGLKRGIPSEIGHNLQLTSLLLNRNSLTGPIPTELGHLKSLIHLDLSKNSLTGTIPTEFSSFSSLRILKLYENDLVGPLPPVSNMKLLTTLNLYQNRLNGTVLAEISELTLLEKLHLSVNQLSGPVPAVLGLLRNLTYFSLRGNQALSGTIPAELGQLSNLQSFYIFTTKITGTVPTELFGLPKLHNLRLNENQLSGPIPTHVGNLTSASLIHLHGNRLTGRIPSASWSALSDLRELQVNDNDLSGSIPPELYQLALVNSVNLTVDCDRLTFNESSCPCSCAIELYSDP
jgi:Leucine-rich repeat (LRR) protein